MQFCLYRPTKSRYIIPLLPIVRKSRCSAACMVASFYYISHSLFYPSYYRPYSLFYPSKK